MPKRILDGEAMWGSSKIAALPEWAKAEYAWVFSLALANGSFECDVRTIWSKCYLYSRPEVTADQVKLILDAFERVGLLFRWTALGKQWGYWVGINKEGRLPPPTQRARMARGEKPPVKALREFECPRPVLGHVQHGLEGLGLVGFGNTKPSQDQLFVDGEPIKTASAPSTPAVSTDSGSGQEGTVGRFAFCTAHLKITVEDHEKLQALFPIFDVKAYYAEMNFWLERKKELRPDPVLFARNWLKREAESLGRNAKPAEVHVGNGSGAQRSSARPPETDAFTPHPMDPTEPAPVKGRVFIRLVDERDSAKTRRDKLWMEGCSAALREMHGD